MTTDIDEIERLMAAATPEDEWFVVRYGDGDSLVICRDEAGNQRIAFMAVPGTRDHLARNRTWKAIKANAALIVALHNSAPAMIAEIRELRAENARLREALDEDGLAEIITDTLDIDWQPRWAAQAIRRAALGEPQ